MTVLDYLKYKKEGKKISIATCYDYWSASIINNTEIDTILVGDSVAMIYHGHDSTIPADIDMMATHTRAVRKGAPDKFIVTDLPFLSHRKSMDSVLDSVGELMKAGANSVKIEGSKGHLETIRYIVESGVPVMGHLGLTPQSFNSFGGFKLQGKGESQVKELIEDAKALEEAGCYAIVLECIPDSLGEEVSKALSIPTIGIGAGKGTDGQVLVLQDMLGVTTGYTPKFVRKFIDGKTLIEDALNEYNREVKSQNFPGKGESYGG